LTRIKAGGRVPHDTVAMNERPIIDLTREKILSLRAETQFTPNGIVSRTLFRTPAVRVVLFGFAAGQELSEHTSVHHALVQILAGECDFPTNGQSHHLKAGDVLYMPPGLRHAVHATQDFSMLLTLIKADAPTPSLEGLTRINVTEAAPA
jgi:quercetin dioxygenase-like cupin family protein